MNYITYTGFLESSTDDIRSKLRAPNGVMYTESLFEETLSSRMKSAGNKPMYSLRECPSGDLPSAYNIYMNSTDETEAALKLVGSLSHWRKLCGLSWFIRGRPEIGFEGLLGWRKDMWDRDRSTAKKVLMKCSQEGNVTAAKALYQMASEDLTTLSKVTLPKKPKGNEPPDEFPFLDKKG